MSRSQPLENIPHPCKTWLEWDGAKGNLRYYDKEQKANVELQGEGFEFVLLDRLATVKGWDDDSESQIYANEVKDTRADQLVVKAFKRKQPIAEGFYADIKNEIKASGGHFVTILYIAFKDDAADEIKLASLALKGAALRQWMEFENNHRAEVWKQAIRIDEVLEGQKGKVKFQMPAFQVVPASDNLNQIAYDLDKELQTYLKSYFKRNKVEQVTPPQTEEERVNGELAAAGAARKPAGGESDEESIPF